MPHLLLVRHGKVDWNGAFYGHRDLPLSAAGERQLQRTAAALAHIPLQAIHCSDLDRAHHSARIIAAHHDLTPQPDAAFREMSLGVLEGLPFEELPRRYPHLSGKRYEDMWSFRFPGGENLQDIADRARPALQSILDSHDPELPGALMLVAHNSVTRLILGDALGLPLQQVFGFDQDFGCVNCIDYRDTGARVRLINWTPDALQLTEPQS